MFKPEYAAILAYIKTLATPDEPEPGRDDWFKQMDHGADVRGWDVDAELPPEV